MIKIHQGIIIFHPPRKRTNNKECAQYSQVFPKVWSGIGIEPLSVKMIHIKVQRSNE